jgi:copper chaperone CopZ
MSTVTLSVPDMSCGSCVAHIRQALAAIPGVAERGIDLARHEVRVELRDPSALAAVQAALAEEGYPASPLPPAAP